MSGTQRVPLEVLRLSEPVDSEQGLHATNGRRLLVA